METGPQHLREEAIGSLETTNTMQLMLVQASGLSFDAWITQYASVFRELIEQEPGLIQSYETDPADTLRDIADRLEKLTSASTYPAPGAV
jgi:hypothetical protein